MFKRLFASFLVVAILFSFSAPAYASFKGAVGKAAIGFVVGKAIKGVVKNTLKASANSFKTGMGKKLYEKAQAKVWKYASANRHVAYNNIEKFTNTFVAKNHQFREHGAKFLSNLSSYLSRTNLKLWKKKSISFRGDTRIVYQRNSLFDTKSSTNLSRMRKGNAPIGKDGKPIELHHLNQIEKGMGKRRGSLTELNSSFHKRNTSVLHINKPTRNPNYIKDSNHPMYNHKHNSFRNNRDGTRSSLDQNFTAFKKDYWIKRAEELSK